MNGVLFALIYFSFVGAYLSSCLMKVVSNWLHYHLIIEDFVPILYEIVRSIFI